MNSAKINYSFLTTYQKDFVEKPINRVFAKPTKQEFKDPVGEGFRKYLLLDQDNVQYPDEDGEKFVEKFRENYKSIAQKYLAENIDKNLIIKYKVGTELITEYKKNYCDIEKDIQLVLERRKAKEQLPDDTYVPLTTYKIYFRDPALYGFKEKVSLLIPPTTLHTSDTVVTQPTTSYNEPIGNLGGLIVKSMHSKWQQSQNL